MLPCDSGVHHKKKNCESNQVISKVQQVLRIATKANQLYPKYLTLTVASVMKKTKLRKGNGGWGDKRDHNLCMNVTWSSTNYWIEWFIKHQNDKYIAPQIDSPSQKRKMKLIYSELEFTNTYYVKIKYQS